MIGIDDLSCESALYWRSLTEHLASLGSATEELLEHTLPTPSHFAKYLKRQVNLLTVFIFGAIVFVYFLIHMIKVINNFIFRSVSFVYVSTDYKFSEISKILGGKF